MLEVVSRKGGYREGAGRPKGTKNPQTLEKRAVLQAYDRRVMRAADKLFNAQLALALGSVQVFRVDEEEDANGKKKRVHTLVTDPDEIKAVLDEGDGGPALVNENYYFVTEISPSNQALDSMLNRTFGKPKEQLNEQQEAITDFLAAFTSLLLEKYQLDRSQAAKVIMQHPALLAQYGEAELRERAERLLTEGEKSA